MYGGVQNFIKFCSFGTMLLCIADLDKVMCTDFITGPFSSQIQAREAEKPGLSTGT